MMWFKNLYSFRLTRPLELDHDALQQALQAEAFQPCGKLVPFSYGWVAPLGRYGDEFCHSVGGFTMLCARKEERLLPAGVIQEQLTQKVQSIEEREARPVRSKERQQLKEEIIHTLLPKAFTRSSYTFAFLDFQGGWLHVDAASAKKAEELSGLMRQSVEGYAGHLPQTTHSPQVVMTRWLQGQGLPAGFTLGEDFDLQSQQEEGGVVRCRRQDPLADEVQQHLLAGKDVTRLALDWQERLEFILAEDMSLKRLRFADSLKEEAEAQDADPIQQFDNDFALMSLELTQLVQALVQAMGGESHGDDTEPA